MGVSTFDPLRAMATGGFNASEFVDPVGGDPLNLGGSPNKNAPGAFLTGAGSPGSKGYKPGQVSTTSGPDQQMADIANSQYGYYKRNYVPFENKMIANATGDMTPRISSALNNLSTFQQNAAGIQNRSLSRYGMAQDPRMTAAMNRQQGLSNAAQSANLHNTMAQGLYDQNLSTLGSMTAIGRGLSTQAIDGIGASAANESARNAQYSNAKQAAAQASAAQQAANIQTGIGLAALSYLAFSDSVLKDNVESITDALGKVETLTGVTWQWNDSAGDLGLTGENAGVIAQDVEVVLPGAVIEHPDGYKAVNYAAVIGLLVNAVKELSAEVRALKETK